ncbi:DUF4349 domain-containing protein, partial [Frankia nepalensis]|uniref:DUF4349 domain-containing protein n=1 Tax=Frankia nepalensis TaxID=1836974 RepID=UPI001EE46375
GGGGPPPPPPPPRRGGGGPPAPRPAAAPAPLRAGWAAFQAARTGGAAGTAGRTIELGGRRIRVTRRGAFAAVLVLVVLVVAIAALGGSGGGGDRDSSGAAIEPAPAMIAPDSAYGDKGGGAPGTADGEVSAAAAPTFTAGSSGSDSSIMPPTVPGSGAVRPAGAQPRIVWTGSMSVEVPDGTVESAINKIRVAAEGLGGYLAESQVSGTSATDDDDRQSAAITLRVPSGKFTSLQDTVGGVGVVSSSNLTSQDVTGEYVDLEARKSALVASRSTFQELLTRADTIGDVLSVQREISSVQAQIEQIEGQLKVLADQSDYATLSINLYEKGGEPEKPDDENGFVEAFRDAGRDFVNGLEDIISALGGLALVLLVLVVAYLLYRLARVVRRRRSSHRAGPPGAAGGPDGQGGPGGGSPAPAGPAPADPAPVPADSSTGSSS